MQVYSTYVLQAILATLFVCIYGFRDLKATLRKRPKPSGTDQNVPVAPAYQHSLDSSLKIIWTAFTYFGCAVNVAGLINTLIAKDGPGAVYTIFISSSAIGFCTQAILSVTMYRKQLSLSERWYVCVCLLFGVINLFGDLIRTIPASAKPDQERLCIWTPTSVIFLILSWAFQGGTFGWMLLWALARWRGWAKSNSKSKAHRHNTIRVCSLVFRTVHAALNLVSMWLFLCTFIVVRQSINQYRPVYFSDNEWGFGQITAILSWIPVFVEMARVWGWKAKCKRSPFRLLIVHSLFLYSVPSNDFEHFPLTTHMWVQFWTLSHPPRHVC